MKQAYLLVVPWRRNIASSRRLSVISLLISASCLVLALAHPLRAQTTASIFGTVTDQSKAIVVGVQMVATNTLTNEVRTTATNESGYYSFPELAVGTYTVTAESVGFKTSVREGIQLSLNRNARVDMELAVGEFAERISVNADAPLVEATTNEMGGLVDQSRIVNLPLNGRNTLSLVSLIPGAQQLISRNT